MLLAEDGPRVIDFGISRAVEASALTHTGLVVGSPRFMSPEQAEGRAVADGTLRPGLLVGDVIALEDTGRALAAMSGLSATAGMTVIKLPGDDR